MPYYKRVSGSRCYLSPIDPDDALNYTAWLNDPELSVLLQIRVRPVSIPEQREVIQKFARDPHQFAIVDQETDRLIGGCGLKDVDLVNRSAQMGIFLGDRDFWGKGYGEEATRLLVDFAFTYVNLRSIMLEVFEFNPRAIRCYEKVGFKKIGVRRCSKMLNNRCYNEVLMDIVSDEFDGTILAEAIPGDH